VSELGPPVRVAVVGVGYWGPNLARNVQDISETSLELVCDLRPEALARISTRYPGVRTATDFAQVLADDAVEAIVIATPVGTHAELASAALAAGKHVLVEKPIAASSAEAESLIDLAERCGRIVMPGHTFLYSPPVNLILELIRSGALGEIHFISSSRVNLGLHQSDVSVVWDLGAHDFSILRYWLDELPERVSAVSRSCVIPGMDDVAFVSMQFPSGTLAHVEMSWLAPSKLRRTAVVGADKMVVYDDTSTEPVKLYDSGVMLHDPETFGEFRLTYRAGDIISPRVDAAEPLALELQDFCRAVRTGGTPRSSAGVGVDVVRMIEAVERSLHGQGTVESAAEVSAPSSAAGR
jgi:predicted dehydrogenase